MIVCSAALKAHLAQSYQTTCTSWLTQKKNGEVIGFTEHDLDISFNLEAWMTSVGLGPIPGVVSTGLVTYRAAVGHSRTDISTTAALDLDNLVAEGPLQLPSLVRADVQAGLWDAARFTLFLVNWVDLSMGALIYRSGTLGEITIGRGTFHADLLGISLAYAKVLGRLTSASCPYILGDAECKVNLAGSGDSPDSPVIPFTVTGTLTGVEVQNRPRTLYDTARTEPGPTGGIAITGVTQANPGVVTTATDMGLLDGAVVTITGVVGMTEINTQVVIHNPSGNTFELSVDTSGFGAYTSGGIVHPQGSDSGWFDNGLFTFDSGANAGFSMEIQSYAPGQFLLELPMPYAIAGNEDYTAVVGCDKSFGTCGTKFGNKLNFGGEPWTIGMDKLLQVGRQ